MLAIKAARAAQATAAATPSTPPRTRTSDVVVTAGSSCEQSPPVPPCVPVAATATSPAAGTHPAGPLEPDAAMAKAAGSTPAAKVVDATGTSSDEAAAGGCGCGGDEVGSDAAAAACQGGEAGAKPQAQATVPSSALRDDEPVNPDALMLEFFATRRPPKFVFKRSKRAAAPAAPTPPGTPVPQAEAGAEAAGEAGTANTSSDATDGSSGSKAGSDGTGQREDAPLGGDDGAQLGDKAGADGGAGSGSAGTQSQATAVSSDAPTATPAAPDAPSTDTPTPTPVAAKPATTAKSRASDAKDKSGLAKVSTDLLPLAEEVLRRVLSQFGSNARFMRESLGEVIPEPEADTVLRSFLKENRIKGKLSVKWVRGLNAAGKVNYSYNNRNPEKRKFTLWVAHVPKEKLQHSSVLRKRGIHSFAYHEIGTHLVRALNDGLQPWAGKWAQYGMRARRTTRADIQAEEGLASLNTVLPVKHKFLWAPALLYYAAAKAKDMNFVELFDHLERFEPNKELRWKHCVRAKNMVEDNSQPGGYGRGQAYFEGAVAILRSLDTINLRLLWAGRLNLDDVQQDRVNRLARLGLITVPGFCRLREDTEKTGGEWGLYRAALREIGEVNGILAPAPRVVRQPSPQRRAPRPTTVPSNVPSMLARAAASSRRRDLRAADAREHMPPPSPIRTAADIQAAVARLSRPASVAVPAVTEETSTPKRHRRRRSTSQVRSRSRSRGAHHRSTRSDSCATKQPPATPICSPTPAEGGAGSDSTAPMDASGWPVGAWKPWQPSSTGARGAGEAVEGDAAPAAGSRSASAQGVETEATDARATTPVAQQRTLAALPEVRLSAKRAWTGPGAPPPRPSFEQKRGVAGTESRADAGSKRDPSVSSNSGRTRSRSRSGNRRRGRGSRRSSKVSTRSTVTAAPADEGGPREARRTAGTGSAPVTRAGSPVASDTGDEAETPPSSPGAVTPLAATAPSLLGRHSVALAPNGRKSSAVGDASSPLSQCPSIPSIPSSRGSPATPPRSVRTTGSPSASDEDAGGSCSGATRLMASTPSLRSGARVPLASPIVPRTGGSSRHTSGPVCSAASSRTPPAVEHVAHVGDTLLSHHGSPGTTHRHVVEAAWVATPVRSAHGHRQQQQRVRGTPTRSSSHRSRSKQDSTPPRTPLHRPIPRVNLGMFADGLPAPGAVGMHVTEQLRVAPGASHGTLSLIGHRTPLRVRHPPTLHPQPGRGVQRLSRTVTLPQPQYRAMQQRHSGATERLRVVRAPSGRAAWHDQLGATAGRHGHQRTGGSTGSASMHHVTRSGFAGSGSVPRSFGNPHRIW